MSNVQKSPDGWARFRARTDNGAHKRAAVRPYREHVPAARVRRNRSADGNTPQREKMQRPADAMPRRAADWR